MKKFRPQVRTKNFSAAPLRGSLGEFPMRAIVRLGSRTSVEDAYPRKPAGRPVIEINTVEACHNSGDKILMKKCFTEGNVKTADWAELSVIETSDMWDKGYPVIIKHRNSSKGKGIYLINTEEELGVFLVNNNVRNYIIEIYKPFVKEYRLHVTAEGCFYTCRKMLKRDAEERWHRHDTNSVWILEENPLFEKPSNWLSIEEECVKALLSVGLDVGACDVKVASEKNKPDRYVPDFIILEINSAPAMGEVTLEKYKRKLAEIINSKL